MDDFAAHLRARRALNRQSQHDVAALIGKSRSWVASLERGEFAPRAEDVARLAGYLELALPDALRAAGFDQADIDALVGPGRPAPETVTLTRDELDALVTRAARRAIRLWLEGQSGPGETPTPGPLPGDAT